MNNQINVFQQRLFNNLFATLPSIKKTDGFKTVLNMDFEINHFYYFKNEDFWFANDEKEDKYYFLFGLNDKPMSKISGKDVCLIIDFDTNIQFNETCLGLFYIKNYKIHILINNKILKERYPNINTSDFKVSKLRLLDPPLTFEVIDLGDVTQDNFINNVEKLIKASSEIKPQIPRVVKTDSFGNKNIINQMNIILEDLANGKTEDEAIIHSNVSKSTYKYWINRGKQDFGDIYVQFYNLINGIKSGEYPSYSEEINEKCIEGCNSVDDGIYEPILLEYEDLFNSMNQTGIAWVDKIGDKLIYSRSINGRIIKLSANTISELYKKVRNNDLVWGIRDYDRAKEFIDFPDDFEIPKRYIEEELNEIDLGIFAPLPAEYERSFNSMNQTGIAWVNQVGSKLYYAKSINKRNIRLAAENIYDLYDKVKKINQIWGIRDYDRAKEFIDFPDDFVIPLKTQVEEDGEDISVELDYDIYAPLPAEYEKSFKHTPMNKSGIAWVSFIGKRWKYSKKDDGETVTFDDENIYRLHKKVKKANQIWGIRDYDRAKEFIDFPDDFVIPLKPQVKEESFDNVDVDPNIFTPLSAEYERSFNSMNQTGIAWVNQIGNKLYYVKSIDKKNIRLAAENIYDLYDKVKKVNQIWGIRDYDRAKEFIDFPEDFVIPLKSNVEEQDSDMNIEVGLGIYAPLSRDHISKFNPNPNNRTGIAWVNKGRNKWFYKRQQNGKIVTFSDSNIIKLYEKVISNNQIWGIIDIDKARKAIETNSLDDKQYSKYSKIKPIAIDSQVTVNYIEKSNKEFEILIRGIIKNKDLIEVLSRLELFKENIKRIITNSINKDADIFIELEINKGLLSVFEEKIEDLGWKLNK